VFVQLITRFGSGFTHIPAAWNLIQLAVVMGEMIMPESSVEVKFRSHMIKMMERFPSALDYVVGMKFKPQEAYTSGAFVGLAADPDSDKQPPQLRPFAGSIVGHMMPQPPVRWVGD